MPREFRAKVVRKIHFQRSHDKTINERALSRDWKRKPTPHARDRGQERKNHRHERASIQIVLIIFFGDLRCKLHSARFSNAALRRNAYMGDHHTTLCVQVESSACNCRSRTCRMTARRNNTAIVNASKISRPEGVDDPYSQTG